MISKKCTRIYESLLKTLDVKLYKHLIENEVVPELHLTRWLRCVLSREFSVETTLIYWDFIFASVQVKHVENLEEVSTGF